MSKRYLKCLYVVLIISCLFFFTSCSLGAVNGVKGISEVDFSEIKKVQVTFNERISDITIAYNDNFLELDFSGEKDLFCGAHISISADFYKIVYSDMVFEGEAKALTRSFLPNIIFTFFNSFQGSIALDSFDEEKNCSFVTHNINGYFVTFEVYEAKSVRSYAIVIK